MGDMESLSSGSRQSLVQELKEYTERCQSRLYDLLRELGWEKSCPVEEQVIKKEYTPYIESTRIACTVLSSHRHSCAMLVYKSR